MPPVIIAVGAAVAGAAASAAVGGALLGAAVGALAAVSVTLVGSAVFGLRPKSPDSPSFTQQTFERKRVIRSSTEAHRIVYGRDMVSGPLVFVSTSGNDSEYLHYIVPIAGHEIDAIEEIWLNDRKVEHWLGLPDETATWVEGTRYTENDRRQFGGVIYRRTGKPYDGTHTPSSQPATGVAGGYWQTYQTFIRVKTYLGTASQTADADLVAEVSEWTTAHRLRGIAYLYLRLKWDEDVFVNGIPNVKALVRGRKVFDPRSGLTVWSDNFALCVRDYLLNTDYGIGLASDEYDDLNFAAQANLSDENVTITVGGATQKRYTVNGSFTRDQEPRRILEAMLMSADARVSEMGGKFYLRAAAASVAVKTITAGDLRDSLAIKPVFDGKNGFNAVRGLFIDKNQAYQPTDFPPIRNATYETQDGQLLYRDVEFSFIQDPIRAQRIAKIILERARQQIQVTLRCKLTVLDVAPWDVVNLDLPQFGFASKPFRVLDATYYQNGGIDFVLQEEAAESYNWNFGEATVLDPAPNSVLPNPNIVGSPRNLTAVAGFSEILVRQDGTASSRIKVNWDAPESVFIAGYTLQFKRSADTNWISTALPSSALEYYIADVVEGQDYDVRVRAENSVGARSPWAIVENITVAGISAATLIPAENLVLESSGSPTQFIGRDAKFRWTRKASLDVYKIGSEPEGPNTGYNDPYFRDYEVKIYTSDGVTLLRTEYVVEANYTYTLEKNAEDGGPRRSFKIEVRVRDVFSRRSSAVTLTVSNPAPGTLTGVSLTSSFRNIFFSYTEPSETDWAGVIVHMSTISGFTPADANKVYQGRNSNVVIPANSTTTYYLRFASYDTFGLGGITYSPELSIATAGVTSFDLEDGAVNTAKLADLAVIASKIANDAINSDKLANGAVTATKIANLAVGSAAIAALAVGTAQIQDAAISNAKIASAAVDSAKIADASITTAKIADASISSAKIQDATISTAKIQDAAITNAKINSVSADKITAGIINASASSSFINLNASGLGDFLSVNGGVARIRADGALFGTSGEISGNFIVGGRIGQDSLKSVYFSSNVGGTVPGNPTNIVGTFETAVEGSGGLTPGGIYLPVTIDPMVWIQRNGAGVSGTYYVSVLLEYLNTAGSYVGITNWYATINQTRLNTVGNNTGIEVYLTTENSGYLERGFNGVYPFSGDNALFQPFTLNATSAILRFTVRVTSSIPVNTPKDGLVMELASVWRPSLPAAIGSVTAIFDNGGGYVSGGRSIFFGGRVRMLLARMNSDGLLSNGEWGGVAWYGN